MILVAVAPSTERRGAAPPLAAPNHARCDSATMKTPSPLGRGRRDKWHAAATTSTLPTRRSAMAQLDMRRGWAIDPTDHFLAGQVEVSVGSASIPGTAGVVPSSTS